MIDVVIPVFNRPDYTESCLKAIVQVDHGAVIRPVVVDNGSRAKTKEVISKYLDQWNSNGRPLAGRVQLDSNKGFAGAIGAYLDSGTATGTTHVIIMHNDVVPCRGWAREMLEVYEALAPDDESAAVMPRTCYANENSVCFADVRKVFEPIKPSTKDRLLPDEVEDVMRRTYEPFGGLDVFLDSISWKDPRWSYCPEIASFCVMIKPELFEKYGRFDTDFFPKGYEDKFWFLRLERKGLCCHVANRAYVHHFGNMTSDGPGFCMPDITKALGELYKKKVEALNKEAT